MTINYRRYPFVWMFTFLSAGIAVYEYFPISGTLSFYLMVLCLIAALVLRRVSAVFILTAFLFLGLLHSYSYQLLAKDDISRMGGSFYGKTVQVEGVVGSDAEVHHVLRMTKTVFRMYIKQIDIDGKRRKASGEVLVNLFRAENIRYGEHLLIEGRLHKPFNFSEGSHFSYRDYLNRKGIKLIFSIKKDADIQQLQQSHINFMISWVMRFKEHLNLIIENNFSGTQMGLMQGFLLGDRYNIPEDINQLFQKAGVIHILAVSGFNVGLVAYVVFLFLKILPLGRKTRHVSAMIILVIYAVLTGAQPPVVRATIMATVFLVSFMIEREPQPVNTLACAAFLILIMNPLNIFDVGFQLSFLSVWSIIVFYPRISEMVLRIKSLEKIMGNGVEGADHWVYTIVPFSLKHLIQSGLVSISAYAGVIMLIVYYFEIVTPVSILANLFVIPLASIIVILGLGLLIIGLIVPAAAILFANCIKIILALMVWVTYLCVQIPGAYFTWKDLSLTAVFIYYILLLLILIRWSKPYKIR